MTDKEKLEALLKEINYIADWFPEDWKKAYLVVGQDCTADITMLLIRICRLVNSFNNEG